MTEFDVIVPDRGLILVDAQGRPPRVSAVRPRRPARAGPGSDRARDHPARTARTGRRGPGTPHGYAHRRLPFAEPDRVRHPLVRPYLARRPSSTPWFRPGWLADAIGWVDTARPGRTGPVEQVQSWSMSCVLRVPYADGNAYFKAVQSLATREPGIIKAIAGELPSAVPEVLAHDPARGWWLSADFGGTAGPYLSPADRAGALTTLATVQSTFAKDTGAFAVAGCPVLDADALSARVPALMAREELWIDPGRAAPPGRTLPSGDRLRWADFALDLQDQCAELGDLGLPLTVAHGDFHPNNTVRRDGGFLLYDWSFAAISYPLLDLASWLHEETSETVAAQHVSAYARGWSDTRTRAAWRVARPVAALTELLKFVDLADAVGPDHAFDFEPMAYAWVRRLVAAVEGADAGRIGYSSA